MITSLSRAEVCSLPTVFKKYSRKRTWSSTFWEKSFTSSLVYPPISWAFAPKHEIKKMDENKISLFLIINIFQYYLFVILFQLDKVGDEPTRIESGPVKLRQFEVPLINLKKVEFNIRDGFKLNIALFYFIKKQREKIGFEILGGVGLRFGVIL